MENEKCRLLPMDERFFGRPCEVDGRKAIFIRFIDVDRLVLKLGYVHSKQAYEMRRLADEDRLVMPGCEYEVIREIRALVEWFDGSLSNVALEAITFTD